MPVRTLAITPLTLAIRRAAFCSSTGGVNTALAMSEVAAASTASSYATPHHDNRGPKEHLIETGARVDEERDHFVGQVGTSRPDAFDVARQQRMVVPTIEEAETLPRESERDGILKLRVEEREGEARTDKRVNEFHHPRHRRFVRAVEESLLQYVDVANRYPLPCGYERENLSRQVAVHGERELQRHAGVPQSKSLETQLPDLDVGEFGEQGADGFPILSR